MKKIITAIGNEEINQKLKELNLFEIIGYDIQYQEGILEVLENQKEINILILSEKIQGNINIIDLLEEIKRINNKIEIILILENNSENLKKYLYNEKIKYYIIEKEIILEDILILINKNDLIKISENNEVKDIAQTKILNKENNINKKKLIKNEINKPKYKFNKIISITGCAGIGKSIITCNLAKIASKYNKKILIIDLDILDSSIPTIFGINKLKKIKKNNICEKNNIIIKINKKIDLLSFKDFLSINLKIEIKKIENLLIDLKKEYDLILIDNSSDVFFDITKSILKNSDEIIFIIEGNTLQINKSKRLLKIYTDEWKINRNKIKILCNKFSKKTISKTFLKEMFYEFKIIGKIKFNDNYNNLINYNMKIVDFNKSIREEYDKIIKKILILE